MNTDTPRSNPEPPPITVGITPRFELFAAIRLVLSIEGSVHERWRRDALARLSPRFYSLVERLSGSEVVWSSLADGVECLALEGDFDAVLSAYSGVDPERFRQVILEGVLHSEQLASLLAAGDLNLRAALDKVPSAKQEWLTYVGLYPFDDGASIARFLERVIAEPDAVRDDVAEVLREFWDCVFSDTWRNMRAGMDAAAEALRAALATASLAEVAMRANLRVEIDERRGRIRAALGGYERSFADIERIHLIPSAFNTERLWTAFEDADSDLTTVVFPCLDPAIALYDTEPAQQRGQPRIDAQTLFKALGNPRRYAMVRMLAREPQPAVALARRLGLTRATVSHHVQQLRMAGILEEEWAAGSVNLHLRRDVFEQLSRIAIEALFDDGRAPEEKTERRTTP